MGDINKNLLYKFYDKGKEEANKFINNLLTHNVL